MLKHEILRGSIKRSALLYPGAECCILRGYPSAAVPSTHYSPLHFNVDFNPAVEYYLDFDADTKAEYIDLFDVEASTGQLTLNRKNFAANDNNFNKDFVFFVDAQVQCATESPLRRRTTVRVHVANLNATNMHVTNLIETRNLTRSFECIKLTHRDFELNTKLALTQVRRN